MQALLEPPVAADRAAFPPPASVASPPLRLGFLTPHDARDPMAFSGSAFHAADALARTPGVELSLFCPVPAFRRFSWLGDRLGLKPNRARIDEIEKTPLDAVVGFVATDLIDRLRIAAPLLHVTDATPSYLRETYGWNVPSGAEAAEARVLARASRAVYSSHAMAARAESDFAALRPDTAVLPFGVNLRLRPDRPPEKPPLDRLELVFLGSDWTRKGGDVAIAALDRLAAAGRSAHLTVIGTAPRALARRPDVTLAGYLDRSHPKKAERFADILGRAHLMLLPTRADCTPMVIAEAMAHGTPVLATDLGGIVTLLPDGGPGARLPLSAGPEDWARAILSLTGDDWAWERMSRAAFAHARDRLSWSAWASGIARLARRLAAPARAA